MTVQQHNGTIVHWQVQEGMAMGASPSKGTPADKRLKTNRPPAPKKK
ncbi:MAG TPA: hypothetical protein VII01_03900 [Solirubrobacteraceae bacterium]